MQVVCFMKISLIYMTSYRNFLLRFGLVNITDFTKLHILHIFFKKNIVLTRMWYARLYRVNRHLCAGWRFLVCSAFLLQSGFLSAAVPVPVASCFTSLASVSLDRGWVLQVLSLWSRADACAAHKTSSDYSAAFFISLGTYTFFMLSVELCSMGFNIIYNYKITYNWRSLVLGLQKSWLVVD